MDIYAAMLADLGIYQDFSECSPSPIPKPPPAYSPSADINIGLSWSEKRQCKKNRYVGYQPMNYFNHHLKLLFGCHASSIPDHVLTTVRASLTPNALNDSSLYTIIWHILKKAKLNTYYPKIFLIINELGGTIPELTCSQLEALRARFKKLLYIWEYTPALRAKRHNLPCFYLIIRNFFNDLGIIPFYRLPTLKDPRKEARAQHIYNDLMAELLRQSTHPYPLHRPSQHL